MPSSCHPQEHQAPFCGLYDSFPCEWLPKKVSWNPHIVKDLQTLATAYRAAKQVRQQAHGIPLISSTERREDRGNIGVGE